MKKEDESKIKAVLKKNIRGVFEISSLAGDASTRKYYRINKKNKTLIAMVYPQKARNEIKKILKLTLCYNEAGLNVPLIIDQIDENILLLEDLGDTSLQSYLSKANKREKVEIRDRIKKILEKISKIPINNTDFEINSDKMKYEVDFFVRNFVSKFLPSWDKKERLKREIFEKLEGIGNNRIFAHRDFHSRNIHVKKEQLYLIDFQDSLLAPKYYDAVSFVFDSYIKKDSTDIFFSIFNNKNKIEIDQVYLTAYQRIIKALGTFGYQYFSGNKIFFQYINPAISNLKKNKYYLESQLLCSILSEIEKNTDFVT